MPGGGEILLGKKVLLKLGKAQGSPDAYFYFGGIGPEGEL